MALYNTKNTKLKTHHYSFSDNDNADTYKNVSLVYNI